MITSKVVEPTAVEAAADVFSALADPARVRIVAILADDSRCVCDIRRAVPIAENLLSYHLRVLRTTGLIEGNRRGRWVDYRLSDEATGLIAGAVGAAGLLAVVEPADPDQQASS